MMQTSKDYWQYIFYILFIVHIITWLSKDVLIFKHEDNKYIPNLKLY